MRFDHPDDHPDDPSGGVWLFYWDRWMFLESRVRQAALTGKVTISGWTIKEVRSFR
jgi:hypothetical protein